MKKVYWIPVLGMAFISPLSGMTRNQEVTLLFYHAAWIIAFMGINIYLAMNHYL